MQLENVFENPTYNEDPIYDSISSATGRSVAHNLRQLADDGVQDLLFLDGRGIEAMNTIPCDQSTTYEEVNESAFRDRINKGQSVVVRIARPGNQYATPRGKAPHYAILLRPGLDSQRLKENENNKEKPAKDDENYMKIKPANTKYKIPQYTSGAVTEEGDYMKPVDGHYKIPRQSHSTADGAVYENTKIKEESQA